jgi:hypothetical protein
MRLRRKSTGNVLLGYSKAYSLRRMDPQAAVAKLVDAGWSELRIAKAARTNQPTINRIKRGASRDCMYSLGVRLVSLAEGLEPTQSPAVASQPAATHPHPTSQQEAA